VNAKGEGCLPYDWNYYEEISRFSHNEPRPNGIPDAGSIRVDFIFESAQWDPYNGSSLQPDLMKGHWVSEDDYGITYSLQQGLGEATCPIGSNPTTTGSCLFGHWSNAPCLDEWADEDDYCEYVYWPKNGDSGDALGWFWTYWTDPWPSWAMHCHQSDGELFILVDFVYLQE
jgi:hypothetical protein